MLIIEGTDLVGKTTLAKKMVSGGTRFGPLVYRRLGLLPGDWNYYDDYVNRMSHLVVQDRFFLSEWCYGRVARGYTRLTRETMDRLYDDLDAVGAITVIITASENTLRDTYTKRGDDLFKLDEILKVNEAFEIERDILTHNHDNVWSYVVTDDGLFPSSNDIFISGLRGAWMHNLEKKFQI